MSRSEQFVHAKRLVSKRFVVGISLFLLGLFLFVSIFYNAFTPSDVAMKVLASVSPQTPSALSIPALNIESKVEQLAINTKGDISSPSSFSSAGWYSYQLSASTAVALIDGHVNNGLGLDGVFANLENIHIDDSIDLLNKQGSTTRYTVRATTTLPYTAHLSDIVSLQKKYSAQFVLITCEGTWVRESKTYSNRLVVLAIEK